MFEDFNDNLSIFYKIKKYLSVRLLVQLAIFLCGISISGFGLFQLFSNDAQAFDESVSNLTQVCEKSPEFGRLTIDIGGAIKNPGVYELETGSRVNDLINIAGGFSNNVDKHYINKVLNLSKRLSDGEKFYIPTLEESVEVKTVQKQQGGGSSGSNLIGMISINSASKDELISLVGIGEKRAEDIISGRPYDSPQQLIAKDIITESIFENIKNSISL